MEVTSLFHWPLQRWFQIIGGLFSLSVVLLFAARYQTNRARQSASQARARMRMRLVTDEVLQQSLEDHLEDKLLTPVLESSPGRWLAQVIEQGQTGDRPGRVVLLLLLVLVVGIALGAYFRAISSGLTVGLVLDCAIVLIFRYRAEKAKQQFTEQLPEVFLSLATALRVGQNLQSAFDYVSRNLPDPAATEFRKVYSQLRMGRTLSQALESLYHRHPSSDLEIGKSAILIQTDIGGNLSGVLRSLANTIRIRRRAEADIRIATQQVRYTVYIVAGLVPALALIMNIESPGYLTPLFTPGLGILLLFIDIVCVLVGVIWTIYLVRVTY